MRPAQKAWIATHHLFFAPIRKEASCGFESRSLDSESRVLTVTPRDHLDCSTAGGILKQGYDKTRACWRAVCVRGGIQCVPLKRRCKAVSSKHRSHFGSRYTLGGCACAGLPLRRRRLGIGWVGPRTQQALHVLTAWDPLRSPSQASFPPLSPPVSAPALPHPHALLPRGHSRSRADLNRDRWIQSPEC